MLKRERVEREGEIEEEREIKREIERLPVFYLGIKISHNVH